MCELEDGEEAYWARLRHGFPSPPKRAVLDGLERYVGRVSEPASPSRRRLRRFVVNVYDVDREERGTALLTTHDTTFTPHLPVPGAIVHIFAWEEAGQVRQHAYVLNPRISDVDRARLRKLLE